MKTLFFAVLMAASLSGTKMAYADMASDLLKASDGARGGVAGGLTWKTKIETTEDGESSEREFIIKAKDHDALVEATSPARTKGEIYLFNDRNMWFFKPSLKKPVSISPRQKLSGQAANGDIASTHYARDYTATLEKTETRGADKIYVLMLKAKSPNLTYDQIRYYINGKTKLAEKAEFLTLQGQVFKVGEMEYNNFITIGGKKSPFVSKMSIVDAKFKENKSVINYEEPKTENHAAALFNINNLSR
ncbi:outer membrane lipoprotein-sorting protein [Bdellovibrio svalbardensis]|uniref:Outer membrane lipoprotein-sorting protein n=1 Tax=Bdellovibrio svalbardensis TaxID=2972972 RepID=A0ABT6DG37_9BACT|nr:outer membrane lipoprotein-sorting protein [Bdellovibrio svalbardensis]MDG0815469.1 outer membrane lipoprotein-sorting protein [Bdellovibrio svalbardensis]